LWLVEPSKRDLNLAMALLVPGFNSRSRLDASPGSSQTVPPRILMAEDNAINQRVGMLILERAGFSIDVAADGVETLDAHRKQPYDLILMDCQMPIMDGFEASREIRKLPLPQPAIIAVTANALVGERERCLRAGMDDYLSKPFQAEQLVAVVAKWVAIRKDDKSRAASTS
jgi:CheY-like chemotaxis protein